VGVVKSVFRVYPVAPLHHLVVITQVLIDNQIEDGISYDANTTPLSLTYSTCHGNQKRRGGTVRSRNDTVFGAVLLTEGKG
jgi:hypothetical protein